MLTDGGSHGDECRVDSTGIPLLCTLSAAWGVMEGGSLSCLLLAS